MAVVGGEPCNQVEHAAGGKVRPPPRSESELVAYLGKGIAMKTIERVRV